MQAVFPSIPLLCPSHRKPIGSMPNDTNKHLPLTSSTRLHRASPYVSFLSTSTISKMFSPMCWVCPSPTYPNTSEDSCLFIFILTLKAALWCVKEQKRPNCVVIMELSLVCFVAPFLLVVSRSIKPFPNWKMTVWEDSFLNLFPLENCTSKL